jgi:hypothetical protein
MESDLQERNIDHKTDKKCDRTGKIIQRVAHLDEFRFAMHESEVSECYGEERHIQSEVWQSLLQAVRQDRRNYCRNHEKRRRFIDMELRKSQQKNQYRTELE